MYTKHTQPKHRMEKTVTIFFLNNGSLENKKKTEKLHNIPTTITKNIQVCGRMVFRRKFESPKGVTFESETKKFFSEK